MNTTYQLHEFDTHDELHEVLGYEDSTDTLVMDDLEIRLDLQLGDDDLGVSLLLESLEEQYAELLAEREETSDRFLTVQSAREWLNGNKNKIPGLFRYLKSLVNEQTYERSY